LSSFPEWAAVISVVTIVVVAIALVVRDRMSSRRDGREDKEQ
jgi:hypothetical protein